MRGGVVSKIDGEPLDVQIERILSQSTFEFISHGAYGFVFKVTFNGTDSGFINPETDKEVKEFIIKVQSIDSIMQYKEGGASKSIEWERLMHEVVLQQELYEKSLEKFGNAVCPAILYYEGITIEKFETYIKDQFIYYYGGQIPEKDYGSYHVAIIVMELGPSRDLETVEQEIPRTDISFYWRRLQDLKNKAFTIYCMALLCGIDQNDVFGRNFLLSEDDNVTMIDFGLARKITDEDVTTIQGHIDKKEISELKTYLKKKRRWLGDWLFEKGYVTQPYSTELLDFPKSLPDDIVENCKTGICKPTNTKPKRKRIEMPKAEQKAEPEIKKTRCEKEEKGCSVMGGKRRTKYVGTRRHKRLGTRRKV